MNWERGDKGKGRSGNGAKWEGARWERGEMGKGQNENNLGANWEGAKWEDTEAYIPNHPTQRKVVGFLPAIFQRTPIGWALV